METVIRRMIAGDRAAWIEMRLALWPHESFAAHAADVDRLLNAANVWNYIAEAVGGAAVGFAEISLRNWANGCRTQPVPFLEGIWVKDGFRRHGLGSRLLAHATAFLSAQGFDELGSDAHLDNLVSHAAHQAWGFSERVRVVYFRKCL